MLFRSPFPDPGYGAPIGGPGQRATAPTQQRAPEQAVPQKAARTAPPPAPQVRRTAVAGRYGEAVVREILGAQFIEETALHEDGA